MEVSAHEVLATVRAVQDLQNVQDIVDGRSFVCPSTIAPDDAAFSLCDSKFSSACGARTRREKFRVDANETRARHLGDAYMRVCVCVSDKYFEMLGKECVVRRRVKNLEESRRERD